MRRACSSIFLRVWTVALTAGGCQTSGRKTDTSKMVREMLAARHSQTQIPYPTKTYGSFGMERAYRIQADLASELSKELGPVVGYKVAYASKAAQKQFGVTEPARGPFFSLQRVPNDSKLPAGHFMEIALETEVAFTIGKRIDHAALCSHFNKNSVLKKGK
jgi:2-keto-4-pentenoate hydratase